MKSPFQDLAFYNADPKNGVMCRKPAVSTFCNGIFCKSRRDALFWGDIERIPYQLTQKKENKIINKKLIHEFANKKTKNISPDPSWSLNAMFKVQIL